MRKKKMETTNINNEISVNEKTKVIDIFKYYNSFLGTPGTSGTSGINGKQGTSGISGTNGISGTSGISGVGTNGTSGVSIIGTPGSHGTSGVNGLNGSSGRDGKDGKDGKDSSSIVSTDSSFFYDVENKILHVPNINLSDSTFIIENELETIDNGTKLILDGNKLYKVQINPKSFCAFISQNGISSPTITSLKNDIGSLTFLRTSQGIYKIISNNLFTDKTVPNNNGIEFSPNSTTKFFIKRISNSEIELQTKYNNILQDNLLNNTFIQIDIYI